jgi:hypothetical protein
MFKPGDYAIYCNSPYEPTLVRLLKVADATAWYVEVILGTLPKHWGYCSTILLKPIGKGDDDAV